LNIISFSRCIQSRLKPDDEQRPPIRIGVAKKYTQRFEIMDSLTKTAVAPHAVDAAFLPSAACAAASRAIGTR